MYLRKYIMAILVLCTMAACKKTDSIAGLSTVAAKTILNVPYGVDARQVMDIYLPEGRRSDSTKVMVLIHGGGWTSGDKADFNVMVDTLKNRLPDYAVFNINYRLSTGATNAFPTQETDVQAAVRYIFGKASDYQVSTRFVLMGGSAGAHLAMLQGYKDSVPVKPKAIVSFFGPSDLLDMYYNPVGGNPFLSIALSQAIGKTPVQDPLIYLNSSPVNFINPGSPPTILLHGGLDPLVSASQSVLVKNKLTLFNVINQYVFYPAGGHGDWDAGTYTDAFNKIQAFLTANVH